MRDLMEKTGEGWSGVQSAVNRDGQGVLSEEVAFELSPE